jgi:hypothetical protein
MSDPISEPPLVTPAFPPHRKRRGVQLLILALVVGIAAVAGIVIWQQSRPSQEEKFLERFRNAAVAGGPALDEARRDLLKSDQRRALAEKLAEDNDPKVRAALVDALTAEAPRAQPVPQRWGAFAETKPSANDLERGALNKLLVDPDPAVRLKALTAVSELAAAWAFEEPLLAAARKGSPEERVAVAASMAHWNGDHARLIFIDSEDPVEVRLAAFEGAKKWGFRGFANPSSSLSLLRMLRESEPRIRLAALEAARHNQWGGNVPVWLAAIKSGTIEEKKRAYALWIERLVEGPEPPGNALQTLNETSESLLEDTLSDRATMAIGTYVLCRAAMEQAKHYDRGDGDSEERAFRLNTVVRPLLRLPRQMRMWKIGPEDTFVAWLPGDTADRPMARPLRQFVNEQLRDVIAWAEAHRNVDVTDVSDGYMRLGRGLKSGQRVLLGDVLGANR